MLKPVVIIVSAGLVLAGCSDDAADQEGLLGALGRVRATAQTRTAVEYGEPAEVSALMAKDRSRYQALQGYGYGSVATYSVKVEEALGLDLGTFDSGIVAGEPGKQATVLWGEYDVSTVDGKLSDLGIDKESSPFEGTHWRSADDYEIDFENGPFTEVAPPAQFNNIVTRADAFAFAPAAEGIDWVTDPGEDTLATNDVLGPLATCLGDVIAAQLQATGEAVSVRKDGTEVICLARDEAQVSEALKGKVPSTGQSWDELLPNAEVGTDDGLVRITVPAQDDEPVGRVLRIMLNGDLAGLR